MKGKNRLVVLLLTFFVVLSQMSVTVFAAGFTVSFDPGEAKDQPGFDSKTMPEQQTVVPNGKALQPSNNPVWEYHYFDGWYKEGEETPFNFDETEITDDTTLTAHWTHEHSWKYQEGENDAQGWIYCEYEGCPYYKGFEIFLDVEDVLHQGDTEKYINLDDPSSKDGFPKDLYEVGKIQFYKGTITKEEAFDEKYRVSEETVNKTEGFYTARVIVTENSNDIHTEHNLFKPFQVVTAAPLAAEGLVYKDGRVVVTDDWLLPEGTTAVVRYKHPATGKYVSRENLINDGSIPAGETTIAYVVLPSVNYTDAEKERIGRGTVTISIAAAASDTSSGKKGNGVNTGDTNDIAGLLTMMVVSLGALGAMGYRRRKEDQ